MKYLCFNLFKEKDTEGFNDLLIQGFLALNYFVTNNVDCIKFAQFLGIKTEILSQQDLYMLAYQTYMEAYMSESTVCKKIMANANGLKTLKLSNYYK